MYAFKVDKKIYTVSRLNQEVQQLLESGFGTLWLQGELSNFSRPASGHFYFSLKDSQAQIRCAMFKGRNRYIDFKPDNGDAVIVRGKLGLYAARGDYQLIVEHMEPVGAGKLQAAFEATKKALDARGWFAAENKKPLPLTPRNIGIVSSPSGAAIRDVLQVLARRYRQASIIVYPTLTQGAAAAPAIARALQTANRRAETDVLLLVRGGGSLEDLWAFNEIAVAEAIRSSEIPVVAGIGHEVDITISDLVSDLRAPTPSAAAELATPDHASLQQRVDAAQRNLGRVQRSFLATLGQTWRQYEARLQLRHPSHRLREKVQRVDELEQRLTRVIAYRAQHQLAKLQRVQSSLHKASPVNRLTRYHTNWQSLHVRLGSAANHQQSGLRSRFEILARALHTVSPLAVLDRGYALVKKNNVLLTNTGDVSPGDKISARLAKGELLAIVSRVTNDKSGPDNAG